MTSGPLEPTLAVQLDRSRSAPPLIDQLAVQIRRAIETGDLPGSSRLPSTRALAEQLGVSRTVTSEAYATLLAEGYLESRRGSGTYVVERAIEAPREGTPGAPRTAARSRWLRHPVAPPAVDPPADPAVPFRICEPDSTVFPDAAWRTAARSAVNEALDEGYPPPEGDADLRQKIAAFLLQERGLAVSSDELMVTAGTAQSLDLIARATLRAGDRVAFEDPGYRLARQIFSDRGAVIDPVPVDDHGLVTEALVDRPESATPMVAYVTPSHQFPLGGALSFRRRRALLDWAARRDVLVVEDDYDSEFRFDGPVLPALRTGDSRGTVAYLGTFSKSLSPRLRLGYVIAPPALREALLRLKVRSDQGTHWLTQRIVARYLGTGAFSRHLRRMRRLYRRRRDALVEAFEPLPAGVRWCGLAAGLHATLLLPPSVSAVELAAAAKLEGVTVASLADYQLAEPAQNGLVLGYGASPEDQVTAAGRVLRRLLEDRLAHG
ncbi:MAG: PLP-dependent aminotransferase family protein [Acidobacteriota bacterium]